MSEALLHRFTIEDYLRVAESGALDPDARVELLNGQIVDMLPIGPFHSSIAGYFSEKFGEVHRGRWFPSPQGTVQLNEYYLPQPDFMLLRRKKHRWVELIPSPKDVFLLIEISETSLHTDRTDKVPAYAAAGISEVWLVNVAGKNVEIYRSPTRGKYVTQRTVRPGQSFSPEAFPDVELSVSEVFNLE